MCVCVCVCVCVRHSYTQHASQCAPSVFVVNFVHSLFVGLLLLLHLRNLVLQTFDQIQVIMRDIIVVILDLTEFSLVISHQLLYMRVLALLDGGCLVLSPPFQLRRWLKVSLKDVQ